MTEDSDTETIREVLAKMDQTWHAFVFGLISGCAATLAVLAVWSCIF